MFLMFLRWAHTFSILGAAAAFFWGLLTGGMYLLQSRRLRLPSSSNSWFDRFNLPSLELLARRLRRVSTVATLLLGLGVGLGFLMNRLRTDVGTLPVSDLLVVGGTVLFLFLAVALVVVRLDQERSVRRTAFWAILCALALALLLILAFCDTRTHWHWNDRQSDASTQVEGEAVQK